MRRDHELTIPELVAKIEELIGYVRIKSYGEGFEEGRKFERGDDEECADLPKQTAI